MCDIHNVCTTSTMYHFLHRPQLTLATPTTSAQTHEYTVRIKNKNRGFIPVSCRDLCHLHTPITRVTCNCASVSIQQSRLLAMQDLVTPPPFTNLIYPANVPNSTLKMYAVQPPMLATQNYSSRLKWSTNRCAGIRQTTVGGGSGQTLKVWLPTVTFWLLSALPLCLLAVGAWQAMNGGELCIRYIDVQG